MSETTRAGLVVIGNEILSGKVTDINTPYLAKHLRELGVSLERVTVIPDDVAIIAEAVREYSDLFDVVFTSGGVGPTHDDITMDAIAAAFGVELVEHPDIRRAIEGVSRRPKPSLLKMAQIPDGAVLIMGANHAFPTIRKNNVYILPGIPEIFQAKVGELAEQLRGNPYYLRQILVGEPETEIAEYLNATLAAFPDLLLGSYPKLANPNYSVRLTLESKDEAYVDRALEDLIARLPNGSVVAVER